MLKGPNVFCGIWKGYKKMKRILPVIPKIHAIWNRRSSVIPTCLEVPMSDGSIVQYYPESKHPGFVLSIGIIRKMHSDIADLKTTKEQEW